MKTAAGEGRGYGSAEGGAAGGDRGGAGPSWHDFTTNGRIAQSGEDRGRRVFSFQKYGKHCIITGKIIHSAGLRKRERVTGTENGNEKNGAPAKESGEADRAWDW